MLEMELLVGKRSYDFYLCVCYWENMARVKCICLANREKLLLNMYIRVLCYLVGIAEESPSESARFSYLIIDRTPPPGWLQNKKKEVRRMKHTTMPGEICNSITTNPLPMLNTFNRC